MRAVAVHRIALAQAAVVNQLRLVRRFALAYGSRWAQVGAGRCLRLVCGLMPSAITVH